MENFYNLIHQTSENFDFISSQFVLEYPDEYKNTIKFTDNLIFCSLKCSKKHINENFVTELIPSKYSFPINNLILICKDCGEIIKAPNAFYTDKYNPIENPENKFFYETTFIKYFLKALIINYIKKFFVFGFNFKLDNYCTFTSNWLNIVLTNLIKTIDKDVSYYRVQKKLNTSEPNIDLKDKELMRLTDIRYSKNNRLTKLGIYNLYLAEDIETGKKEIRYSSGDFYYAKFTTKKELTTIDFTNFNDNNSFNLIANDIYNKYVKNYGKCYQTLILIKSTVECFRSFIIPELTKQSNEDKPFKPEYVIPQFISDISKLTLVHSITYYSTRNENKKCLCFFINEKINEYFNQTDIFHVI